MPIFVKAQKNFRKISTLIIVKAKWLVPMSVYLHFSVFTCLYLCMNFYVSNAAQCSRRMHWGSEVKYHSVNPESIISSCVALDKIMSTIRMIIPDYLPPRLLEASTYAPVPPSLPPPLAPFLPPPSLPHFPLTFSTSVSPLFLSIRSN